MLGQDPGEGERHRPPQSIDPENPPGSQFSECSWPADDPQLVLGLLSPSVGESPVDHLAALQESESDFVANTRIVTAGREGVEIAALVGSDANVVEATAVNGVLVYLQPLIPIAENSPEFQALANLLVDRPAARPARAPTHHRSRGGRRRGGAGDDRSAGNDRATGALSLSLEDPHPLVRVAGPEDEVSLRVSPIEADGSGEYR